MWGGRNEDKEVLLKTETRKYGQGQIMKGLSHILTVSTSRKRQPLGDFQQRNDMTK